MKIKIGLTCIFIFTFLVSAFSQVKLKGKVTEAGGEPIPAVNLTLKTMAGKTLSFTMSSKTGDFTIDIPDISDQLELVATAVGLKTQSRIIDKENIKKDHDLIMAQENIKIQTVDISNRPQLVTDNDTLNYKTSDFSGLEDRTIGDVLRKMPGIKIEDDGQIKYNGKAISNFYIDGDNLLNDRYNVGTKIRHDAIEKVQIIEKDEPIKILQEHNMSDDVALNLVIKDEAKLAISKEMELGVGMPKKFDGNLLAMSYGKKLKFINHLSANNVGKDPLIEIQAHGESSNSVENDKPTPFLSTGTAGNPPLPQHRFMFNTSALSNLNNFYRINSDWTANVNFSYLYHQENQNATISSETYLSDGQKFSYTEIQENRIKLERINTVLDLTGNTKNYFFKNKLIASYDPKRINSDLKINNKDADQRLKQQPFSISNELHYIKNITAAHTINFYSYIDKSAQAESLKIEPGLDDSLFNKGIPYAIIEQQVNTPTFFTKNYLSYGIQKGRFRQHYKAGFFIQNQQITSKLYRQQNDGNRMQIDNMNNDLSWFKSKFYAEGAVEYKDDKLRATLTLPLGQNNIHYQDFTQQLDTSLGRLFIDPSLNVDYRVGGEHYISGNYKFTNQLGGIEDVYRGSILKNYRSLYANDAPVSEQKIHKTSAEFRFKNSLQMLFFNLSSSFEHITANTISSFIWADNLQKRIILPLENTSTVLNFNASGSKYLFQLRSTVNVGAGYRVSRFKQLQNNILENFNSSTLTYEAGIEANLTRKLSWSYQGSYAITDNSVGKDTQIKIDPKQLTQRSSLTSTSIKNMSITLSGEHRYTKQTGQHALKYLFADFNARYVFVKLKTDFEFGISNLTNVKKFETIDFSQNGTSLLRFRLPGRQVMMKATFNF
ncbi:carboxypeptidase-like regulatory domain-containing protein [Sphingobacterium kitahiroshimense]|uniref:Carboxypeptidase-like regulatory domain-containing protein n=1 Tax=Sphingobacterium kitahiroshimense TaxID=470446 RepID=A0ABV0BX72_9SPHI